MQQAENLLKRKLFPVRITNCVVSDYFPEELKICIFGADDFWETIPLGGFQGSGVGFVKQGSEIVLRPEAGNDFLKLKIFHPGKFIDEPLMTVESVRRGDRLVMAISPINGDITVQRM